MEMSQMSMEINTLNMEINELQLSQKVKNQNHEARNNQLVEEIQSLMHGRSQQVSQISQLSNRIHRLEDHNKKSEMRQSVHKRS